MENIKFQAAFADEKKQKLPPAFVGTISKPTTMAELTERFKCSESVAVALAFKSIVIRAQSYIRGEIEKLREADKKIVQSEIQGLLDAFTTETAVSRGAGSKATVADLMTWLYASENAEALQAFNATAVTKGFEAAKIEFLPVYKATLEDDETE